MTRDKWLTGSIGPPTVDQQLPAFGTMRATFAVLA
jgi:hypothetical protein